MFKQFYGLLTAINKKCTHYLFSEDVANRSVTSFNWLERSILFNKSKLFKTLNVLAFGSIPKKTAEEKFPTMHSTRKHLANGKLPEIYLQVG